MKHISSFFIAIFLFFLVVHQAEAALVVVGRDGGVVVNVLSREIALGIERPGIEVVNVSNREAGEEESVFLSRDGERVSLSVFEGNEERVMDVTDYPKELIEIEKRSKPERIRIMNSENEFIISQKGIQARTGHSIFIDPVDNELSLETPSGRRYLAILPYEAVLGVVKANVLNRLNADGEIFLSEHVNGELLYTVNGERTFQVVNLFELSVPVEARVSASTGQVVGVEQPIWFKVFGFLFS